MMSATILDKSTGSNLVGDVQVINNSDPFSIRFKEVYEYVTAKRLFSLLEAFIDNSRPLTAKERAEINAFVFSFGLNSESEKELDADTFEQRAFRSAFTLDVIINDWNEKYHITTENELNAQIDIQTAIEEAEKKVTKAIANKDSDKIKFALMQLSHATQKATEVKAIEKVKKSSNKKLTQIDVKVIKALFNERLATLKMLADAYQMSETAINNAVKGITYRNDAIGGRIFLMKTAHHERFKYDIEAKAVDVALATSAAPTYFSAAPFPNHQGASYVDGGVWANCPALVGLVEAVHFLNIQPSEIDILNIGTTSSPFSVAQNAQAGIFSWGKGLINILMNGQVEASRAMSLLLTNHGFFNIDCTVPIGKFSLDDSSKIDDYHILTVFPQGTAVQYLLPPSIQNINSAFWSQSIGEVIPNLLGIAGITPKDFRIFISYWTSDTQALAEQLFDGLSHENFDVFLDRFRIPPSVNFLSRINHELADKSMVLLLESQNILKSRWTRHEINFAKSYRLGLFAVQVPGGINVPGIDFNIREKIDSKDVDSSGKLKPNVLKRVVERAEIEHSKALVRRRKMLLETMQDALFLEKIYTQKVATNGLLQVSSKHSSPPKKYSLRLTTRPPELSDFHTTGINCNTSALGIVIGPDESRVSNRKTQIDWLSKVSKINCYNEAVISKVARGIGTGSI